MTCCLCSGGFKSYSTNFLYFKLLHSMINLKYSTGMQLILHANNFDFCFYLKTLVIQGASPK